MSIRRERERGERRPRPQPRERAAVAVISAASSIGALFAGAHPTANRVSDAVLVVALVIGVVAAASIARSAAWIFASGIAAVLAPGAWSIVAVSALVVGIVGAAVGDLPHRRAVGALVGGLTVQAVLRLDAEPFGISAVAAALAVAALALSAWSLAHRSTRTRLRVGALVAAGASLVIAGSFGLTVLRSRTTLELGMQRSQEGLAAARAGDNDRAGVLFEQSSRAFRDAHQDFGSWFARPASVLPAVGQHQRALVLLSAAGADVASAVAAAASTDVQNLVVRGGRIDLELLEAMAAPLASVNDALHRAGRTAARARSPWLLSPLGRRLDGFAMSVSDAAADAQTASEAVTVLPGLFGGQGERHYFVAFATPAESRDLGGFTGAYGLLTAQEGKLSLTRTGRIQDLNNAGLGRQLTHPGVFPARYRSLRLEDFWQNITGTPDFPTVAQAVRQMWHQSGGDTLDGVLYVDPYALASLLKLTGPVTVDGRVDPLTADNAADYLLRGQYQAYDAIDERSDFLLTIARTVFDRLTSEDLPGPRTIVDALAPVTRQRRLLVHSFDPDEQQLLARIGIDGGLPPVRGDFLSVRSSNLGQNKIDALLDRTIDAEVTVDPGRGVVQATVTVTLHNSAPAAGLPSYVIGNLVGAPPGTNVSTLAIYTPLRLRSASIRGEPLAIGASEEYGRFVYTTRLDIAPGADVKVAFELEGPMDLRSGYHLDLVPHPAANTDQLHVRVRAANGWRLTGDPDFVGRFAENVHVVLGVRR